MRHQQASRLELAKTSACIAGTKTAHILSIDFIHLIHSGLVHTLLKALWETSISKLAHHSSRILQVLLACCKERKKKGLYVKHTIKMRTDRKEKDLPIKPPS